MLILSRLAACLLIAPLWASPTCEEATVARAAHLLQHAQVPALAPASLRPHQGGPADRIEVEVMLNDFYGVDLHNEEWEGDVVVMLSWSDPRVAGIIPQGEVNRTLSDDLAKELMWIPDLVVTNAEIEGVQVIATSFHIAIDGVVRKTQWLLVKIKENFDGKEFPYDTQVLHVRLASASYMVEDVELVGRADGNISDSGGKSFDKSDWTFLSHELKTFSAAIGDTMKSYAQFEIRVRRDASPYMSSTIFPEIMIVVLSYSAFLFPVNPGFAMPRVSSAVIAFLSILTLSTRISAMLPEVRRGLVWMELFEVVCKMLLFTVILLNLLVEAVFHTWQQPELAKQLVYELRIGFPLVAGLSMASCGFATGGHLELFCGVVRACLLFITALFTISVLYRSKSAGSTPK